MPMGRENKITFSVFLGCFINLVLNYILIKKYNAFGAVIATIITEGIVTIIQIYFSKDYFQVNLKTVLKSLISAVIMFLILKYINNLYLKIFLGGINYILLILFFKEENALEIRNFLILRVKEKFL